MPTRWLGAMSMVSVTESCRTASPRSAMAHMPFFFTRIFLDFRSLCAIPGLPAGDGKRRYSLCSNTGQVIHLCNRSLISSPDSCSHTLRADDLHVQVGQATGCGQGQLDHALNGHGVAVQVVKEGAVLVVV